MNDRILEAILDKLEETLNNIDSNEMLEDIAEEVIGDYLGDPEDEVRKIATEYVKEKVNYEEALDKKIADYVKDMMSEFPMY